MSVNQDFQHILEKQRNKLKNVIGILEIQNHFNVFLDIEKKIRKGTRNDEQSLQLKVLKIILFCV